MSTFLENSDFTQKIWQEKGEQRGEVSAFCFTADQSATYGRNSDHETPNWLPASSWAHKMSAVMALSTTWSLPDPVTEVTAATDQLFIG